MQLCGALAQARARQVITTGSVGQENTKAADVRQPSRCLQEFRG